MLGPKYVYLLTVGGQNSFFPDWIAYVVLGESVLALAAAFFIGQLIVERQRAETELQRSNAYLEQRVQRRTADLRFAYSSLQKEMFKRQKQETIRRRVEQNLFEAERFRVFARALSGICHYLDRVLLMSPGNIFERVRDGP